MKQYTQEDQDKALNAVLRATPVSEVRGLNAVQALELGARKALGLLDRVVDEREERAEKEEKAKEKDEAQDGA